MCPSVHVCPPIPPPMCPPVQTAMTLTLTQPPVPRVPARADCNDMREQSSLERAVLRLFHMEPAKLEEAVAELDATLQGLRMTLGEQGGEGGERGVQRWG